MTTITQEKETVTCAACGAEMFRYSYCSGCETDYMAQTCNDCDEHLTECFCNDRLQSLDVEIDTSGFEQKLNY